MTPISTKHSTAARAPHRRFVEAVGPEHAPTRASRAGLFPGEPENCRRSLSSFVRIYGHMCVCYAVFEAFSLEGRGLRLVTLCTLAALPVHYALPFRWKQPFFVAVSMVGLGLVFGLPAAAATIGLTLGLVSLASLPINWWVRVGLVALAGLGMGLARAQIVAVALPAVVWPIVGSICMFRIIIYLHEIRSAQQRERVSDVLSYFFLLPNFAFHLFPVVDYRTLRRGYFSHEIHATQRAGLRLILRGSVHLLLWRWINHELLISPLEVHNLATFTSFVVCNYLLYLRVSGLFHLACGMLHLFGYRLPETHHHYLLATSFTDYWRRINIYWKDFMVKLVFHPVAFRLKRWPQVATLTVATFCVFAITWLAHGYQSFWLRGDWGFTLPDALFWGILGVLVWINVLGDARGRPRRRLARPELFSLENLIRLLKIAGTLTTITVLWSLWSSPSVSSWLELLHRGLR